MTNDSIKALYSLLARDPMWTCIRNEKDFEEGRTNITRIFRHDSGLVVSYKASTVGEKTEYEMEAGAIDAG